VYLGLLSHTDALTEYASRHPALHKAQSRASLRSMPPPTLDVAAHEQVLFFAVTRGVRVQCRPQTRHYIAVSEPVKPQKACAYHVLAV